MLPSDRAASSRPWWRDASVYQVYLRSFADASGDGIGDLAGVLEHLDHLVALGIDAIWFNPWYPSPMADGGYDVSDYRDIAPEFGRLTDAEALITAAHANNIKVIVDVVPNHCSNRHAWFEMAVAGGPGSPVRDRFWFRPGRGDDGSLPPNNWSSIFGGPAWTRITEPDGSPGPWYLHLFAPEQPDFNWDHPDVRAEFQSVLRFWLDRGVDGIRIDSAALLAKSPNLPDLQPEHGTSLPHPYIDLDPVHEIYRSWRRITDSYPGERVLIGEIWLEDRSRFQRYLGAEELHTAFDFDLLCCPWEATSIRTVVQRSLDSGVPAPTWVLSNHDVVRHVSRYGRADTGFSMDDRRIGEPTDLELGTRRARAAALLTMALPGSVYIYQGDELGLWEVEDLPDELRQDPIWERSGHRDRGRDGCRVPIPWSGAKPPYGFSTFDAEPWLPQPPDWSDCTAEAQSRDRRSMLHLYRTALGERRENRGFRSEHFRWLDLGADLIAFERGDSLRCIVNLSEASVSIAEHGRCLVRSDTAVGNVPLPPDAAAWLAGDATSEGSGH